jgi:competence protein ComEC
MGAGVMLYFALLREPPTWLGFAGVAVGVAACAAGWRSLEGRVLGIAVLAAAAGFLSAQAATWRVLPIEAVPRKAVVVTARVKAAEALPEGGHRVTLGGVRLTPDTAPLARSFRLRLDPDDPAPLAAGDQVRVRALLRAPMPPAYPGAWDVQRDAFFAGQGGSARALGDVVVLELAREGGIARWGQGVRERVGDRIRAALPGAVGAIAATLMTGEQAAIPAADRAAFRDSGLAHLLAVAGLHIGIVMGLAFGLVRRALALSERAALHWPCKAIAAGAALAAGGGYVLLTGAHMPTVRSFTMACLVTLGLVVGRRALSMRGLALAAAVILLAAPNALLGVSFQMSFSAVAALIAGYEAMRPWLARHLAALALTSLLAGGASAAFAAYHFGHMQLYFVVANMAAVPITAALAMPAGLAALALMPFGLERVALVPMGWGVQAILWIGRTVSAWPAATLAVPHSPGWGLAAFALGLAWLCLWRTRVRLAGIAAMLVGLLSPLAAAPPDIVVSSDARLIGVRGPEALLVQPGRGGSGFVLDAWRAYLDVGAVLPLEEGAACDADGCRVERGGVVALILRPKGHAGECAGVAVLVSPEPAHGACHGVPFVDRFSVWRDGAHAIWLRDGGVRVVSDRAWRVSGRGYQGSRAARRGRRCCPWRRSRRCRRSSAHPGAPLLTMDLGV